MELEEIKNCMGSKDVFKIKGFDNCDGFIDLDFWFVGDMVECNRKYIDINKIFVDLSLKKIKIKKYTVNGVWVENQT